MKIFSLVLMAIMLMLLSCTNNNQNGKGNDDPIVNSCIEGVEIPLGTLSQRGGVRVNGDNVREFLAAFEDALYSGEEGTPIQMPEQDGWEIWVRHGLLGRYEDRSKELAEGVIYTREFFDFSQNEIFFIGGGAIEFDYNDYHNTCIVARYRFNGEFSGEMVLDNIRLSLEYNNDGYVIMRTNGKATVNGIDITDLVFPIRRVICYFGTDENGECIPQPNQNIGYKGGTL